MRALHRFISVTVSMYVLVLTLVEHDSIDDAAVR